MMIVSRIYFYAFLFCCFDAMAVIENPLLFEIEKDNKISYVLGTNHALSFDEFPQHAQKTILSCKWLVTETKEVTDHELESMGAFRSKDESSLKDVLSPDALKRFDKVVKPFFEKKGFLSNPYDLKPWAAYATYMNAQFINGMDYYLRDSFGPRQTIGLIALKERASYMIDVTAEEFEEYLLNEDSFREAHKELIENDNNNYRKGIFDITNEDEEGKKELIETNKTWLPLIQELHINKEDPILTAIGFEHLPGEEGLLNLLKQAGYAIRKINNEAKFVTY